MSESYSPGLGVDPEPPYTTVFLVNSTLAFLAFFPTNKP
jgi:hypothetical protein